MQRVRPENRLTARFACFQIPIYQRDFRISDVLGRVLEKTNNAYQNQIQSADFIEDFQQELDPRTGQVMKTATKFRKMSNTFTDKKRKKGSSLRVVQEINIELGLNKDKFQSIDIDDHEK